MTRNIFRGVAGAAALAAALLATAPAASAAPALHPDPSGAVHAGESITISLDGLPPNLPTVAVGQCKPVVVAPTDCNLGASLLGTADAQGVWQPGERGRTLVLTASVGSVDCTAAAGACTLAVTSLTDPNHILTSLPLTFGATETTKPAAAKDDSTRSHTGVIVTGVALVVVCAAGLTYLLLRRGRPRRG